MNTLTNTLHSLGIGLASALVASSAFAEISHNHNHHSLRQHDAHEHGFAQLNVAIDSNILMLEFTSPAANIIGFEHRIKNNEEQKIYDAAVQQLKQPAILFSANSEALCAITELDVSSSLDSDKAHKQHHDFSAEYTFTCHNIKELAHIHTKLLHMFPNTQEVQVQIIDNNGQRTTQLNQFNHTIKFK